MPHLRAITVSGLLVAAGALVYLTPASAHRSGCHGAHTCPSDHHTYVWTDPNTGRNWDCAEPGAKEYDPALDTTAIVWDGYTYYCRAVGGSPPPPASPPAPAPQPPGSPPPSSGSPFHTTLLGRRTRAAGCRVRGPLPDRRCSPGAIFSDATLAEICVSGYSSRVRDVPESEKAAVYAEYGIPRTHYHRPYEIDHIVSLELGGSNDISNLYPEAASPRPGYHDKDRLENRLHALVCSKKLPLRPVQRAIASDWVALYTNVLGVKP